MLRSLLVVSVALIGFVSAVDGATPAKRPNVLFILTDDQRWDALGLAGHRHLKTPHLDRLGREGVRFRNAFCTTALCSPSRASILTGLYAHTHGVTNNFTELPPQLPTWPRRLHDEAGYRTAYIGKWHMGEGNDAPRPGWDWFVTHQGQGKYFDTEFNLNGERRVTPKGYYTTVVTDLAEEWLGQQKAGQPWCLMLGHKAPHSFYLPEPKFAHAFDQVPVPYPETAFMLEDKPRWIAERLSTWHGIYGPLFDWRKKFPDSSPAAVRDFEAMTRAYWATLLSVDESVGRLLALLEKRGELENTLIIYMSDNGLLNGEHGMVDKRTAHEPSMRVVQLARYPALCPPAQPKVVEQQVLTVDVAASVLELCGLAPLAKTHGRSWVQLVQQGDPAWRKAWLYYYNYEKQFPYTPNVRAVRTESWKYSHAPHGDGSADRHLPELYNIEFDPEERHNLAQNPKYAGQLRQMQAELRAAMQAVDLTPETDRMPLDEGIQQALPDQKIR